MALRFLADHCVSNSTVQTLREANHEVLRLKDVLPVESSDTIVITKAQDIDAILLSLNGDFSHIVNYPPKNCKGIVAMQMHNHSEILCELLPFWGWSAGARWDRRSTTMSSLVSTLA